MNSEVGIAILARVPVPGQAKTRLIPALGAEGAARLQAWLLQRTVTLALDAGTGPVVLWLDGDPEHPALAACCGRGPLTIRRQVPGNLGLRMLAAVEASGCDAGTLVIGTDGPAMSVAHLRDAAGRLGSTDAVLIPAEDGGYLLIGMKRPSAEAFSDIDWGTDRVMAQTRERLSSLGWRWDELETLWDLDRPADLERLYALNHALRDSLSAAGPASRRA